MKFKSFFRLLIIFSYIAIITPYKVNAATTLNENGFRKKGLRFISIEGENSQSGTKAGGQTTGTNLCYQLPAPTINSNAALAQVINTYIQSVTPRFAPTDAGLTEDQTPFDNLGDAIVTGATNRGINPLFIVGLAKNESRFGTEGGDFIRKGQVSLAGELQKNFNAFGRRSNASAPHFEYMHPLDGLQRWYKYENWEDSVNSKRDPTNGAPDTPSLLAGGNYLTRSPDLADRPGPLLTIAQVISVYAPKVDRNNEDDYVNNMTETFRSIIELDQQTGNPSLSCQDNTTTVQ